MKGKRSGFGREKVPSAPCRSSGSAAAQSPAVIRASGVYRVLRRRTRPTSIVLEEDLVSALRAEGAKRGLGYQTMLKVIVREHLHEY
jgi:uncharacterized protein (DUF4415 family)